MSFAVRVQSERNFVTTIINIGNLLMEYIMSFRPLISKEKTFDSIV